MHIILVTGFFSLSDGISLPIQSFCTGQSRHGPGSQVINRVSFEIIRCSSKKVLLFLPIPSLLDCKLI